jgi:archaellum component FlaC
MNKFNNPKLDNDLSPDMFKNKGHGVTEWMQKVELLNDRIEDLEEFVKLVRAENDHHRFCNANIRSIRLTILDRTAEKILNKKWRP